MTLVYDSKGQPHYVPAAVAGGLGGIEDPERVDRIIANAERQTR